jgi:signal transduction histidine kinase
MNAHQLKQRVEARDQLLSQAEHNSQDLHAKALSALRQGDLQEAQQAVDRHDTHLRTLVENLRVYQAELHAQADELAASQTRTEALLARFTALFASMPVAVLLLGADGELRESNQRARALLGLRPDGGGARFFHRFIDPANYQSRVRPAFHEAQACGHAALDDVMVTGDDGRRFPAELHMAALPALVSEKPQFACALLDRTEAHRHRAAQHRIEELSDRLSMANEAGGVGVWDWDLGTDALFFDPRMCALLGLRAAPQQDLRTALQGRLHPADEKRFEQALQHALAEGGQLSVEVRLSDLAHPPAAGGVGLPDGSPMASAHAAGEPHWVHLAGRAQRDIHSQGLRLVGCAWDTSAEHAAARLVAAKESAEFASRSKSAFLSRMSHELRTPLNAVLGFSQLMRLEAEAGDLVVKPHRVAMIEGAARHLLELIDEVLDVSRVETGRLDVRMLRFDLREALRECLPMVMAQVQQLGLTVDDAAAQGEPLWVLGDRLRMKEVLINLLSNAVKYNRLRGHVAVTVSLEDEQVLLRVSDTGCGLSADQQAGLFQPFNRLGAEATGVQGSGMGLFVSKRFIELMGGHISLHSEPGQGTRVDVSLKAAPG